MYIMINTSVQNDNKQIEFDYIYTNEISRRKHIENKTLEMIVDYGFTTNRMGWFRLHAVYPMVKQAYMLIKIKNKKKE